MIPVLPFLLQFFRPIYHSVLVYQMKSVCQALATACLLPVDSSAFLDGHLAAEIRERDWCNVVTCHEGDSAAYTWQLSNFVIGEHLLTPPGGELAPVRVRHNRGVVISNIAPLLPFDGIMCVVCLSLRQAHSGKPATSTATPALLNEELIFVPTLLMRLCKSLEMEERSPIV